MPGFDLCAVGGIKESRSQAKGTKMSEKNNGQKKFKAMYKKRTERKGSSVPSIGDSLSCNVCVILSRLKI